MDTAIKSCGCHDNCYNLYYKGNIAMAHETMQVCDNVKFALDNPATHGLFYSEGAEVADVIRNKLVAKGE